MARRRDVWLIGYGGLTVVLAVLAYCVGLGSGHIATTVDELTYVHITRVTAASGRLLPLRSEIEQLRNLKPPALFWQGIVSTDWGRKWTRSQLRYPNVIYTLLTGGLVFVLARKISGRVATGLLAFLLFLAFFSTWRYGRALLPEAPLVFWLLLPFAVLLLWDRGYASRVVVPLTFGLIIGVGVLYKSLALAVPVLVGLGWWFWREREYRLAAFLLGDAWKLVVMGVIAAGIFALWFVFDPDPNAIWRQFILRENVGKFARPGEGYIRTLLWGGESIWKMIAGYPINAGLLAFPVIALPFVAWKNRTGLVKGEKLLWILVLTYLVVFSIQGNRTERYLLPGIPALAILLALNWQRFSRHVMRASLLAAAVCLAVLVYLSVALQATIGQPAVYPLLYWASVMVTAVLILAGLMATPLLRASAPAAVFLVYLCFTGFMRPLDGKAGTYQQEAIEAVRGRELWVPSRFNAREEGYRFLLPGAHLRPYNSELRLSPSDLSARYRLFIVRLPTKDGPPISGKVLGERLDLASQHNASEVIALIRSRRYDRLFLRELLIESAGPPR